MLRRQSEVADAIDQYGVNAVLCFYGWLLIIFVVLLFICLLKRRLMTLLNKKTSNHAGVGTRTNSQVTNTGLLPKAKQPSDTVPV